VRSTKVGGVTEWNGPQISLYSNKQKTLERGREVGGKGGDAPSIHIPGYAADSDLGSDSQPQDSAL